MEKQLFNDGLDDLFGTDEVVISQKKLPEFEELIFNVLSPFYREYLINTYRDLISKAIKSEDSKALIDDYIFHSAEAMTCSDEEIAEKLRESIAMKREEEDGNYLNDLFFAATLPL